MPPSSSVIPATPGIATSPSLKHRAIRSTVWTFSSFFAVQVVRLASNVVLAHLLGDNGREAFGLIMFVSLWLTGLTMFSDVGIGPSIIQNPRGDDRRFLNTAWTIQVIRGFVLWVIASLLAYPVSVWWDEPSLLYVLPVMGVTAAIAGFKSTSLSLLNRRLNIGKVMMLAVGSKVVAAIVMLAWAWFSPTVWSLVAGAIAGGLTETLVSHLLVRPTNRFGWDRDAVRELYRFGRWITVGTACTFLAGQVDKFMLAGVLGFSLMGVFSVAHSFAGVIPMLMNRFTGWVGFPALADLYRRDEARFHWRLHHLRLVISWPINLGLLAVAALGPWAIRLMYPEQYHAAGWMVTALAVGATAGTLNATYNAAMLAMGDSFRTMLLVVIQFFLVVPVVLLGYHLGSTAGFIYAMAAVNWMMYLVHMALAIQLGIWQPKVDIPVLAVCAACGTALLYWGGFPW